MMLQFFVTCNHLAFIYSGAPLSQTHMDPQLNLVLLRHSERIFNALADEDQEQDPDRWVSQTANGQEAWQIVSQWLWNLRLEVGHVLEPTEMRTTEFAPALPPAH